MTIVVVRSGGFAGLRREWRVDAGDDDADRWLLLVEACPWDDGSRPVSGPDTRAEDAPEQDGSEPGGAASPTAPARRGAARPEPAPEPGPSPRPADRYVWIIRARTPEQRLERELPEPAVTGPWRDLVEAVRSANRA
ncbi:hypothetical protein OED01_14830 [Microbacterium sp. M28]|uniref:hypothetical protein n=1 Tax=Microbacterium sp. M28 TaxID=2962064 RepID=UPI0021F42F72|nr:hypothetical protein [Microbacterium sp. M28]UYO96856.1 hypothetical protein OED01_14830 [Microbacterium sp. M28]